MGRLGPLSAQPSSPRPLPAPFSPIPPTNSDPSRCEVSRKNRRRKKKKEKKKCGPRGALPPFPIHSLPRSLIKFGRSLYTQSKQLPPVRQTTENRISSHRRCQIKLFPTSFYKCLNPTLRALPPLHPSLSYPHSTPVSLPFFK